MWSCENCKKQNNDNRHDCWNCSMSKGQIVGEHTKKIESPTNCIKCSASLDPDAKFCPKCATPVGVAPTVNCPQCHKSVDITAKFCKFCAAALTQKEEPTYSRQNFQSAPANIRQNNADTFLVAGGGITIVSVIACIWGVNYTSNVSNRFRAGFTNFVGQTDSTYSTAEACIYIGLVGAVVGIGLFLYGLKLKNS